MSDKIPLNDVLNAIDRRDFDWYSRLPDEQKKKWSVEFVVSVVVPLLLFYLERTFAHF